MASNTVLLTREMCLLLVIVQVRKISYLTPDKIVCIGLAHAETVHMGIRCALAI